MFFVVFPGSAENAICNFPSFPENPEKPFFGKNELKKQSKIDAGQP